MGCLEELGDELIADLRGLEGRLHEVGEIEDLDTGICQDLGKGIVLFLGLCQIRRIFEEHARKLRGKHLAELASGPVEHHLSETSYLRIHLRHVGLHLMRSVWQFPAELLNLRSEI